MVVRPSAFPMSIFLCGAIQPPESRKHTSFFSTFCARSWRNVWRTLKHLPLSRRGQHRASTNFSRAFHVRSLIVTQILHDRVNANSSFVERDSRLVGFAEF